MSLFNNFMKFTVINNKIKGLLFRSRKIIQKEEDYFQNAVLARYRDECEILPKSERQTKLLEIYK